MKTQRNQSGKSLKSLSMSNKKKTNRNEIEHALSVILHGGKDLLNDSENNVKFGWCELSIGDWVYFKTYDDDHDTLTVSKGEIIEIITSEKKVMNKPDDNMSSDGWHRERCVSYKIRWNGMTTIIDSRYAYTDKMHAILAAIHNTIKSYFE